MDQIPPPKEVKILETAEDIQERRQEVSKMGFLSIGELFINGEVPKNIFF